MAKSNKRIEPVFGKPIKGIALDSSRGSCDYSPAPVDRLADGVPALHPGHRLALLPGRAAAALLPGDAPALHLLHLVRHRLALLARNLMRKTLHFKTADLGM